MSRPSVYIAILRFYEKVMADAEVQANFEAITTAPFAGITLDADARAARTNGRPCKTRNSCQ